MIPIKCTQLNQPQNRKAQNSTRGLPKEFTPLLTYLLDEAESFLKLTGLQLIKTLPASFFLS
jgi:hypothetical protein